jgi:hypothetical protein
VPHAVVTFAANVCPLPGAKVADAGAIATLRTRSVATFTVMPATLPASAWAWAVTMQVPVPRNDVNTPAFETVPHEAGALQTMLVSLEPVTVAVSATASHAKALTGDVATIRTPLSTVTTAWAVAPGFAVLVATT